MENLQVKTKKMRSIITNMYNFTINATPTCFDLICLIFRECAMMLCYVNMFQKMCIPLHL